MNTWYTVVDLVLGDETKKTMRKMERGLEVIVNSEMPSEVVIEAGNLLMELDALKAKLEKLNSVVLDNSETTMWPVL